MDKKEPLIHIITNSVTINDTVNFVLAAGGAAICADSPREVAEVVSLCDALMINIGTPNEKKLTAMLIAGRRANEMGIPVVLDPVGAGASEFRRQILGELLEDVSFDCIRGNKSEIAALLGIPFRSKGVETVSLELADEAVHGLVEKTGSVILMTGESDLVFDKSDKFEIGGGSPLMKKLTGSGCMYSAFIATRLAENKDEPAVKVVRRAAADYKLNTVKAIKLMKERGTLGTASFRQCLIDAMSINTLGEIFDEI